MEISCQNVDEKEKKKINKEIAQQIDKGLLLGAPLSCAPDLLTTMATKLNENSPKLQQTFSMIEFDLKNISMDILESCEWIKSYERPSMETFYKSIFMSKIPTVLIGCIDHWRALTLWKDPNYLIKTAGIRTVPIELGSKYTEEDWSQHLISFSEFIRSHVTKENKQVGYLAQHQLFDQVNY